MTRRPAAVSATLAIAALAVAACSTGPGSATPPAVASTPSAPPVAASGAGTPVASAAVATGSPTVASLGSPAYRYHLTVPAGLVAGTPVSAATAWDGAARVDSDGPRVDRLPLSGGRLLFVYGAPTDLGVDDYAKAGYALKAAWHSCPTTPDSITEATYDGEPALLYSFECQGNHMLSLYTVHDGFALVVNVLNPPGGDKAANAATFGEIVTGGTWAD